MTRKRSIIAGMIIASFFLGLSLSYSAYETYRVLPENIVLGSLSLAGLNRQEATLPIQSLVEHLEQQKILIKTQANIEKSFLPEDLGITYHADQTLEKIFSDTSILNQLFGQTAMADEENRVLYQPVVAVDNQHLQQQLSEFLLAQERDFTDATILWDNQKWLISPEQQGLLLKKGEVERISSALQEHPPTDFSPVTYMAEYEPAAPQRFSRDLQELLTNIQKFAEKPIALNIDREKFELSLLENKDWLAVDSAKKTFALNQTFAKQWVQEFAKKKDIVPENVVITGLEDVVSEYDGKVFKRAHLQGAFGHGSQLNQDKLLSDLLTVLADEKVKRTIDVESNVLPPTLTSQVEGYQFPQLLSTGISSYRYGNHANRVTNIKLSLGSFQGVVVGPGEELSFNRVTGWIVPAKGYTKTQIIEEGIVKDGVGGGVCQSSSTVYRAILNAGFPVTERRNHTLDVIYYHEFGYGLDATVYTDSHADLRFINDFPGPILINVSTDDSRTEARVEFYGTTDGRRVELTPVVTGDPLLKQWDWKVIWPDREDVRSVVSRYQLPKEEKKVEINPLEG